MNESEASRGQFLRATGGMLGATWIGTHWPAVVAAAEHAHQAVTGTVEHTRKVVSAAQARDVEPIAAQIVPSGDTPGPREAGVMYFIDHVHAGPYATHAAEFLAGLKDFQADFARRSPGVASFADPPDGAHQAWKCPVNDAVGSPHLLGTCRMGDDPKSSVADRHHRTHDIHNLFICDGSSFVTSGRGQPTMTIQALAFRAGEHIACLARQGEI